MKGTAAIHLLHLLSCNQTLQTPKKWTIFRVKRRSEVMKNRSHLASFLTMGRKHAPFPGCPSFSGNTLLPHLWVPPTCCCCSKHPKWSSLCHQVIGAKERHYLKQYPHAGGRVVEKKATELNFCLPMLSRPHLPDNIFLTAISSWEAELCCGSQSRSEQHGLQT